MQQYTRTLIEKETNLSSLLESAIRQNMKEDAVNSENSDEIVFDDDIDKQLTDFDLMDFNKFLETEEEATNDYLEEESDF